MELKDSSDIKKASLELKIERKDGTREGWVFPHVEVQGGFGGYNSEKCDFKYTEAGVKLEVVQEPDNVFGGMTINDRVGESRAQYLDLRVVGRLEKETYPRLSGGTLYTKLDIDTIMQTAEDLETAQKVLAAEQELLWNDLRNQLTLAKNGYWSQGVEHVILRIVSLARATGITKWSKVSTSLLGSGVYEAIHHRATDGQDSGMPTTYWSCEHNPMWRRAIGKVYNMKLNLSDYEEDEDGV